MFAAWLFGYLIAFAIIGNLILSARPPMLVVYVLCLAFFVGLFAAIGLGMTHERNTHTKKSFLQEGLKEGAALFKSWFAFILTMAVAGGILFLSSGFV